ncbi:transcription-repair coupling factor (superfamily II helicase) [Mariniphaga anaerophila]|uniref:Transcription-repair-coupling factor n=1 Tax=Mariniphaga anaerophila TaxID=1484053 RepID=A0A1M5C8Z9_9BACT|nr:transcription-repair coupling factor [Mariniphaga anaerophila]SHF51208.1 transcription-repair coupling factor (superfamily II helicase) [Mariniphaga anaerophila]
MEPVTFLKYFEGQKDFSELVKKLSAPPGEKIHLHGLIGSAKTILAANLFRKLNKNMLLLINDREEAAYLFDDLNNLGFEEFTLFFPSSYKRSIQYGKPEQENIVQRTETLNKLSDHDTINIVVTYPEALVESVISQANLDQNTLQVSVGDKISIEFINEFLYEYGFERVDFVYEPGQFSVRGSIVDIFSYSNEDPYRLDFFGDEVDSIRSFNIDNQISKETFKKITIVPNIQNENLEGNRVPLFEFLPENTIYIGEDLNQCFHHVNDIHRQAILAKAEEENLMEMIVPGETLKEQLQTKTVCDWGNNLCFEPDSTFEYSFARQPVFNKKFDLLAENLEEHQNNEYRVFILSNHKKQIERLQAIFGDIKATVNFTPVYFTLHEGFVDHDLKICCYTDHQIFERYHRFKLKTKKDQREAISLKELSMLHPGDYVVHIDHGIGKFAGLVRTEINGKIQEAIRLTYKNNDALLVNIHSLHRISKYKGKDGSEPTLNKLGTGAWQKMKNRTKAKVKDIAKELIALYAERLSEKGFAFSPDSYLQTELEASFIYEDTPDQEKATGAVKEDMEKHIPMDRLVCGDVGFGKTEIAIRAAFKAVTDSKQVAVLVPTTILALQHYKTFSERLADFPVRIEYISRFKTSAEIKQTLADAAAGKVDILIGTHRLVSKDVKFKDLGLLIIDEEQKFGVSVKEKLKRLKVNVDTLTLTATPIPRTLQFSLMGARDLSIIQTPPPNRYPIITEVHGFNEQIIREAILYEVSRNGQVFFIHNRVQNIYEVEAAIKRIVPEISTVVGHGQMEGPKLEKVMLDFINGDYDVLVATTIIESGLDIPNANTIIINHAENYGLSDLHQLRGRVGRSNKKAFCYLITPPLATVSPEARRRLKAIEEFSDLGSGFNIAMQDLDIRGAGNLLGAEQSGFIADIGFETYHRILNEAVQELKQEEFNGVFKDLGKEQTRAFLNIKPVHDCQIDTDMELLFPQDYVPGNSERMLLYRELDNIDNREQLEQFSLGLQDRFGKLPQETRELLEVVKLRWRALDLGMEKIILKEGKMICHFVSDQQSSFYQSELFLKIVQFVQHGTTKGRMREKNNKLTLTYANVSNVETAGHILKEMAAEVIQPAQ